MTGAVRMALEAAQREASSFYTWQETARIIIAYHRSLERHHAGLKRKLGDFHVYQRLRHQQEAEAIEGARRHG